MKAMILAAGFGKRMQNLTKHTPKPLLSIGDKTLIEHRIEALKKANITDIIINTAYLGEQIKTHLKDGSQLGVRLSYSDEGKTPLNTASGIIKALPFFQNKPFIVTNSDIYFHYPIKRLIKQCAHTNTFAHLVLIDNPAHNPQGDFSLKGNLVTVKQANKKSYTFSGLGYYQPSLFKDYENINHSSLTHMSLPHVSLAQVPLTQVLYQAIEKQQVSATHTKMTWYDVGTPTRLKEVRQIEKNKVK